MAPEASGPCPVCAGRPERRAYAGAEFSECPACGFALLLGGDLRDDYWTHAGLLAPVDERFWIDARRRYLTSALGLLSSLAPGRRLLDLGGGIGFFAQLALEHGWDAYSLDVSPAAAELAAARLGESRSLLALDDGEAGSFDAVTLWCVVAHTTAPETILHTARRALRPGGVIWLTTPNFAFQKRMAALRSRLGAGDFATDDHVAHFTAASLTRLLGRCGLVDPQFHFRGVTETCITVDTEARAAVGAKRSWNRAAHRLARLSGPNLMSELQVTGRAGGRQLHAEARELRAEAVDEDRA